MLPNPQPASETASETAEHSGSRDSKRDCDARPSRWIRIGIPTLLIVVWLSVSAIGGPYFGRVSEVSTNDRTTFLPASAEATQVQQELHNFLPADDIPAIVVVTAAEGLAENDLAAIDTALAGVDDSEWSTGTRSPVLPSEDGLAGQAVIPIDVDADIEAAVAQMREHLQTSLNSHWEVYVTGPAGLNADLTEAFAGIDGLLLLVAVIAVFIILMVVYRALLLPFLVLFCAIAALCAALLSVWHLANADILVLTGQTQGILFILVVGAATDYALLYTARYREELNVHHPWLATRRAVRATIGPVLASGATVIAGLLCLLLSDLGSNQSLGPVAAIGIVFSMLSGLTLLPALLLATGPLAYWPRRASHRRDQEAPLTIYDRVGRRIARSPRRVWIGSTALLMIGAVFILGLRADGVPQSEFVLGESNARDGQEALAEHFPGSSGSPTYIITRLDAADEVARDAAAIPLVASMALTSDTNPSGAVPLTAQILDAGIESAEPVVVDGQVLLQLTLNAEPDSGAAQNAIAELRQLLGDRGLVGGATATALDTNDASIRDRTLIIPVVLLVVLAVLMVLLRSVLAPVILILTTVLSFATAMGISALVFNHLFAFPGADPVVPLYGFVFLVALGIDYNIFLMTRVKEESQIHGTRAGILKGLSSTGGVITSAGIVLAATFAALAVIPILFLAQLAFIVAFGVLLDTFLVRTLLVPALGLDLGRWLWWPRRLVSDDSAPH